MPITPETIDPSSPAVQAHLTIEQSVIQRMSTNSSACKGWAIALVSGILVVVGDKGKPALANLAVPPILLFFVLDAHYLGLERMFRASYQEFVTKLQRHEIESSDLFVIRPKGEQFKTFLESLISFSILPFYGTLLFTVVVVKYFVL